MANTTLENDAELRDIIARVTQANTEIDRRYGYTTDYHSFHIAHR